MAKLEITTRIGCKNMCKYCPQEKLIKEYLTRSKKIEMSLENFKKCINKVPRNVTISFSGMAEPWLNKSCTEMVKYTRSKGFPVEVYVTGVGMKLSDFKELEKMDLKSFVVHLPDNKGETNIKISKDYLNLMEEFAKSKIKNQSFISFGAIHPEVKKAIHMTGHPITDLSKILLSRVGNSSYTKGVNKLRGKISCMPSKNKLNNNVLLPNGDVMLCCMDYGLKYKIGNLLEQDYEDIFKTSEFLKIKKGLDKENINIICRECELALKRKSFKYNFIVFKRNLKEFLEAGRIRRYFLSYIKKINKTILKILNRNLGKEINLKNK